MSAAPLSIVDLDALYAPVARIKLFGIEHDVMPMSGVSYDVISQLSGADRGTPLTQLEAGQKVIADSIPTLSAEQVKKLTLDQVTRIVEIAMDSILGVRKIMENKSPNAESPAEETTPGS